MLLDALFERSGLPAIEVAGITADSRRVRPGDVFVAFQGGVHDGHAFIGEAISNGASCVLTERPCEVPSPVVTICDRALVAHRNQLAARLYGQPSRELTCIGVTGTNGKTSVAYGLASLLDSAGFTGSIGWGFLPDLYCTKLTTEDGIELQRRLAALRKRGAKRVVMEASSHALEQGRLSEVDLDMGIFTNLTQDHLDFHGSMANYAAAKRRLFEDFELESAVINIDDELGRELARISKSRGATVMTYGSCEQASIYWKLASYSHSGVTGTWFTPWGNVPLNLPVQSEFGVANCAAMLATLLHCGSGLEDAAGRLATVALAPGRFEFVSNDSETQIVVDFAHTPDGLKKTLVALRRLEPSELVCVFGCGGDRDVGKRPRMGAIAEAQADRVIVTNDNPRTEDPERIAADVLRGMQSPARARVMLDREQAIAYAVTSASQGAIVLVAGKGAELYQEINGIKHPFNDRDIVMKIQRGELRATLVN